MNNLYACPNCKSGKLYTNVKLSITVPLERMTSITKKLLASKETKLIAAERKYDFFCASCFYSSKIKDAINEETD